MSRSTTSATAGADAYARFVSHGLGARLAGRLGLPRPVTLRRHTAGGPLLPGPVLVAGTERTRQLEHSLQQVGASTRFLDVAESRCGEQGSGQPGERLGGIVLDLSEARQVRELETIRRVVGPSLRGLGVCARVILVGADPSTIADAEHAATQRALEGATRSIAKELRRGATANLVQVRSLQAEPAPAVEFLLSGRAAFVDGQVLAVDSTETPLPQTDRERPLVGRVAVVTGAARGIGAAIVEVLARDGARVIAVDVPASGSALADVANAAGGVAVQLDVTAADAGERIAAAATRLGGLDVLVHNAGITRDKLLANLDEARWSAVLEVNLAAQLRMDRTLLADGGPMRDRGRVVAVSSLSGLAGNRGQTSYAASKAGVAGMVQAQARLLTGRQITYNAVAPGFIETEMTSRIPRATREVGRRLNSLSQGGLPVDVAEAIAFFAQPRSQAVTGQVLRVCGQSLLGA